MRASLTDDEAVRLFEQQRVALEEIRKLDFRDPRFTGWLDTTKSLFLRILSESPHFERFKNLKWRSKSAIRSLPYRHRGPIPAINKITLRDRERFSQSCEYAESCLVGAVDEIKTFGGQALLKPPAKVSGVQQNFHGDVTIHSQAIATDRALQQIGQQGDIGPSLQEISKLLAESMELTRRDQVESLQAIQSLASEIQKPETHRDWNAVLTCAEKVASIANKAVDFAQKLAPYLPKIHQLAYQAQQKLQRLR